MSFFFAWSIEYFFDGVNRGRWKGKWFGEGARENSLLWFRRYLLPSLVFFVPKIAFQISNNLNWDYFFLCDRIRKIEELGNYKFFKSRKNKMLWEDFEYAEKAILIIKQNLEFWRERKIEIMSISINILN